MESAKKDESPLGRLQQPNGDLAGLRYDHIIPEQCCPGNQWPMDDDTRGRVGFQFRYTGGLDPYTILWLTSRSRGSWVCCYRGRRGDRPDPLIRNQRIKAPVRGKRVGTD